MKYFKLKYQKNDFKDEIKIVKGKNPLEIIKKYDLCSKENINTRIIELESEQLAIAISNDL